MTSAQSCSTSNEPAVVTLPAAPTSVDGIEIKASFNAIIPSGWSVDIDGFVINFVVKGVTAPSAGQVRCASASVGVLAAGTYTVNFVQSVGSLNSVVASTQMVVTDAGRPPFVTVLPTYPLPDRALSIRIRSFTPESPSRFWPHTARVSGSVIRVEGCVNDGGFAVPGLYVVTVGVPPLEAGRYRVEYHRSYCNYLGEQTGGPQFLGSFHLDVKNPTTGWPGPLDPVMPVSEYYHAAFDHYFMTAGETEAVALDSGAIAGWTLVQDGTYFLNGKFGFWRDAAPDLLPVCRFFSASFAPKSSHFYTTTPEECEAVKTNPRWVYEGIAGYIGASPVAGSCAEGSPLYRLYNAGQGGAPAHRYALSEADRQAMIDAGWIAEGILGCVPVYAQPYPP
jgi:hypothetical protein